MRNHSKELLDKIRLGEDSFLELKEARFAGERVTAPHRDSLGDELAAFANARGGVCLLGVDDKTREITGVPLELLDRLEDFVREVCNDSIDPPLAPNVERLAQSTPVLQRLSHDQSRRDELCQSDAHAASTAMGGWR